jgi:hypothetical protein
LKYGVLHRRNVSDSFYKVFDVVVQLGCYAIISNRLTMFE